MEDLNHIKEEERRDFDMNTEANRTLTFLDWPFDGEDAQCTSDKMAKSGFYCIGNENEPDLVRCFVCYKELDGWEPDDDPMQEHKSHSPNCAFLSAKPEAEQTVEDFLKLEAARQNNKFMKLSEQHVKEFERQAAETREQLEII
ncbi:unnamed protein product [Owenia fusiformis]|uniref:Uncharacterized protein n=1 Tax=Owenia fusiformis TaxID=6347 RepID=A0A8J1U4P2_OWEFU|nr:unnamed protein product [Owenia fusiformis]